MARTRLSPRCWAVSNVIVRVWPPSVISVVRALYIAGIESAGNSTSTTGPITRAMRPVAPAVATASGAVAVMSLTSPGMACCQSIEWAEAAGGLGVERVRARDDLGELLRDLRLAGGVAQSRVLLDQLGRIVARV